MGAATTTQAEHGEVAPTLDTAALASLGGSFRGELVLPSDGAYEHARRVRNEAINKRPALIPRCSGVVDVVRAVDFARDHHLVLKRRYDPTKLFRVNQNIPPVQAAGTR